VTTFSTGFKGARLRLPPGAGRARKDRELKTRRVGVGSVRERERDHQRQRGHRGIDGNLSAPGASAEPRPLARGAAGRGGRRRAGVPASRGRWLLAVTRVSGTAHSRSVRDGPVQRCRPFFRRERAPSRALPGVASLRDGASATLDCALPRQTHWHLSGWTGQNRSPRG
jgi:hypothetical protein